MLRYHEPEIKTCFDSNEISPEYFATSWFLTIFAWKSELEVVYPLWDEIMSENDHLFPCYLGVAMLSQHREQILQEESYLLPKLLNELTISDTLTLNSIVEKARKFKQNIPFSSMLKLKKYNVFNLESIDCITDLLNKEFCLTVLPREILQRMFPEKKFCKCTGRCPWCLAANNSMPFILIDCRTPEEQKSGFIPNSALLPKGTYDNQELLMSIPDDYLNMKGTFHICLMGSKNFKMANYESEEDAVQNMVGNLLQLFIMKGFPHISIVEGGFETCHEFAMHYSLEIANHNSEICLVCNPDASKMTNIVKRRFNKFTKNLIGRFRKAFAFEKPELTTLSEPMMLESQPNLDDCIGLFACQRFDRDRLECNSEELTLIITKEHLALVNNSQEDQLQVIESAAIRNLLRITSLKKFPNILIFWFVGSEKPLAYMLFSEEDVKDCMSEITEIYNAITAANSINL